MVYLPPPPVRHRDSTSVPPPPTHLCICWSVIVSLCRKACAPLILNTKEWGITIYQLHPIIIAMDDHKFFLLLWRLNSSFFYRWFCLFSCLFYAAFFSSCFLIAVISCFMFMSHIRTLWWLLFFMCYIRLQTRERFTVMIIKQVSIE